MPNNRITKMNQWGDILYCGKYKRGDYRGIGDYPTELQSNAVEEIITKLYYFEEALEDFEERMEAIYGKRDSE